MAESSYDLVIIGGGPGGYVAALRGAQLGLRTALVERDHLGGICLNWGCIPTKSLLHTADTVRRIRQADALGLQVGELAIDFAKVMARSRAVAQRLNRGVTHLLKKAGVTVYAGSGSLAGHGGVVVRGADDAVHQLAARHVILATGAHPRPLPAAPFDGKRVWSYRDALAATTLPRSMIVAGAGAIGMELASFYATLGSKVTVVEAQPRVLPASDADVSTFMLRAFERDGIAVHTGAMVEKAEVGADTVRVKLQTASGSTVLEADRLLVAIGLAGNVEGLGLEHTQVRVDRGQIATDAWGQTGEPGVWAIGDLVGAPMLAHKASHQGMVCVERIAGLRDANEAPHALIPACTYCHPQTASVGLTEQEAAARGLAIRVGTFPLEGNGKAVAIGEAEGFVKTLFDAESGALLGAHLVGPDATELIQGFTLAASLETTEAELMETVFAHPTLSEAMHESVLAAFGRALHI